MHVELKIAGMTVTRCAHPVEKALTGVEGVEQARVNYLRKEAHVQGDVHLAALPRAVEAAGYGATPKDDDGA